MRPTAKLTSKGPGAKAVLDGVKALAGDQVYVGIPERSAARKKSSEPTNAQLAFLHTHGVRDSSMRRIMGVKMLKGASYSEALQMYLHSHGDPLWQIPPRPIIEPAIEANQEAIEVELRQAAEAAMDGKKELMQRYLNRAGLLAQNFVRAWFTDPRNGWPPNAPSTIRRKKSAQPLIDTGQLRKSITYVLALAKR